MDVAGAPLNRRSENEIDEPDDRGLTALLLEGEDIDFLHILEHLDVVVELPHVLERLGGQRQLALADILLLPPVLPIPVIPVDGRRDGRLRGNDRLHVVAGHELDVVDREDVGRV